MSSKTPKNARFPGQNGTPKPPPPLHDNRPPSPIPLNFKSNHILPISEHPPPTPLSIWPMSKSPPSSSKRSGGHANCRPLRPPLVIVQVFLERLSSPWESHFDTANAVQIRFFPFSSSPETAPAAAAADGHLSVGNGRLFIMRQDQIGWLQLDIGRTDGEGASGGWRGRLKLVEEGTLTTAAATAPMCRRIACELRSIEHGREDGAALPLMSSSSSLTAHLLVSVDEVRKRREERGGHAVEQKKKEGGDQRKKAEDGWAQTEAEADGTSRQQEIGVQTVKEEQATEATATEEKQRGQRWRRATAARVMMLMMAALNGSAQAAAKRNNGGRKTMAMMIGGRRAREVIGTTTTREVIGATTTTTTIGRETKERETMTRVSIPPNANSSIRPHPNQSALISQYRAQIAYLSAVHRTLVPQRAGNERKRRKTVGGRRERKTEDDDGIRGEEWREEEQQPEERMGRTRTDVEEGWMKSVKWWEGGRERTTNGRDDDEGSSILQSVAISESEGSVAADERSIRKTTPEGMNARIMAGLVAIRRTTPEEMSGRIILDEGTKRVTPEGMNGRAKSWSASKGTSASSASSSAPTRKKSIATASSSSSSSSSKRSSSSSVSSSSTPSSSSPSAKGSSEYQQQKLAESPTNSSSLKGSSAKTDSSIATDISKNGKSSGGDPSD